MSYQHTAVESKRSRRCGGCIKTSKRCAKEYAVDAELVKHGQWIVNIHKDSTTMGQHTVTECSECGYVVFTSTKNFCANCGARMDGGEEDEEQQDQEGGTDFKKNAKE